MAESDFAIAEWPTGLGAGFDPAGYALDGVPVDSISIVQRGADGRFEACIMDVDERLWTSGMFRTLDEARRALCAKLGIITVELN